MLNKDDGKILNVFSHFFGDLTSDALRIDWKESTDSAKSEDETQDEETLINIKKVV